MLLNKQQQDQQLKENNKFYLKKVGLCPDIFMTCISARLICQCCISNLISIVFNKVFISYLPIKFYKVKMCNSLT